MAQVQACPVVLIVEARLAARRVRTGRQERDRGRKGVRS
jgi:hypothetical protein